MKLNATLPLSIRIALAAAFLIAGLTRAAAQTATSNSASTPALMLSFNGQVQNSAAGLTWVMENETNSKWYVIERSGATGGYDSIGVVDALNYNNMTTYTFTDEHMLDGNNYYRVRQVSKDGVDRYSRIVTLYTQVQAVATVQMSLYPNPAAATVHYSISSPSAQQVVVQVYDLTGVALLTNEQELNAGNNTQTVAISTLRPGNYFLKVTNREGSCQYVQPFVKIM